MAADLPAFRCVALNTMRAQLHHFAEAAIVRTEEACWKRALDTLSNAVAVPAAARPEVLRANYVQACAGVVANLTRDSQLSNGNAYIRSQVDVGATDIATLPLMSGHQLTSDTGARSTTRRRGGADALATDAFECPRCTARKCVHYELQTRSADEATTVFVTCVSCGHRWTE